MSMLLKILEVKTKRAGSTLAQAASIGDTILYPEDLSAFTDATSLTIGSETIAFEIDWEDEYIELATALTANYAVEEEVYISPALYVKTAVLGQSEDIFEAAIPAVFWPYMADGSRSEGSEEIAFVDDEGHIINIVGGSLVFDGAYVDVNGQSILDDGQPPPDPVSAPSVLAGLGYMSVSWLGYPAPYDIRRFIVQRDANDNNWAEVAKVDGRTPFYFDRNVSYGTSYRYKFLAEDWAGNQSAFSPSSTATAPAKVANIDLDANAVDAINLIDSAVTAAKIAAGAVGTSQLAAGAATISKIVVPAIMVAGLTLDPSTGAWSGATVWQNGTSYAITNNSPAGGTNYIYWTEGQTTFSSSAASPTGTSDHIIAHKNGSTWEVVWHRGLPER